MIRSAFSAADNAKIRQANRRVAEGQIDRRLAILDRDLLGNNITVRRLVDIMEHTTAL